MVVLAGHMPLLFICLSVVFGCSRQALSDLSSARFANVHEERWGFSSLASPLSDGVVLAVNVASSCSGGAWLHIIGTKHASRRNINKSE